MCQGNEYTFSLCTSAPANNFSLSVTGSGATFPAVAAGYYGPVFDNDGCGIPNGPAQLTFSPQTAGLYRIRVFQNPCVLNAALCGTLRITCSIPTPPPNDIPCTAIAFTDPVPIACTFQPGSAVWGSTEAGIPAPGCGAYFGRDVWYSAVVPPSGNIRFQTSLVSATSLGMAVYNTPACNAPLISWGVVACNAGPTPSLDVSGLVVPGSTIYIRIWPNGYIGNMGTFNICAFEPTPPFNDLPCLAFNLPTPGVCSPGIFTTEFATNTTPPGVTMSPAAPTCGGTVNNDVWFAVTVPPTGAFTINTFAGSMSDMAMAWYRLSVGGSVCNPPGFTGTMTQIACNDDQFAPGNLMPRINSQTTTPAIAPALVPGETIYIRVWPKGLVNTPATNGTFSICATENVPPPNDEACGAIPLATSLSCNLVPATNEGASTNNTYAVPPCGGPVQNDVWYSVTVPPNGQIEFNTQPVGMTDAAFALYTTSGGCAPANLSLVPPVNCQVGGSGFGAAMPFQLFAGLTPGSTVYLRVWRQAGNVGPFNICARQTAAAPLFGCDLNSADSGGPLGNYGNNEVFEQTFCPVNAGDVVAIDFTSFSTQLNADFLTVYNGPSIASPVLGVFSGGSLPPGLVSSHPGGCLTIRFTSNASVVSTGWVISVSCGPPLLPPPPPCHTTTFTGTPLVVSGSNFYDSGGPSGQYLNNNELSTYTFCPSVAGEVITLTFTSFQTEANFDFLTVFNGPTIASPSMGTFSGTVNPGTFVSTAPGGCLTVRWTSDISILAAGWSAVIRCGVPQPPPPPPPPPTGVCGTTVYDPGGASGNYMNGINQTPANFGGNNCWPYTCIGAGATIPPGQPLWSQTYCPDIAGDAVTLSFLTFNIENGWDNVYIYNGPVVSPNNANGTQWLSGNGLPTCGGPAGWCNQTLGAGGFTGNANPGSFTSTHPSGCLTISMTSDDIVNFAGYSALISCQTAFNPNAPCIFALRMYDIFGDGWTGSSITVTINGGTPTTYTVTTGNFEQVLISANNGDNIQITYNGWGYFPQDNYWTFDLVGQQYSMYQSAIPAVTGTITLSGVNCSAPIPPPNEDCPGATILCNNTPVQMTPTNNGSIGDLTAANSGCVGIYERPGEWYTFRAGITPSIGFSIAPSIANTDVNFAVWGPFSPSQTVPDMCALMTTAPKRCSFASAANTFAATGSYNTGMGHPVYSPPQFQATATIGTETVAGDGWVPGITATAGDIFVLFVSNASMNQSLLTLTWTNGVIDCWLPVEFTDFNAFAREAHVDVEWKTSSELNAAWFDVQRSADNSTFETIGRVNAAGNSMSATDYRFMDPKPLMGQSYYRLQQVDNDGTSALTHSVPVYFKPKDAMLQVYPNPVRDELFIALDGAGEGTIAWRMLDASGRTAKAGTLASTGGTQQLNIGTGSLESGAYMLILQQGTEEIGRQRFVKH
ncbi:MAG: T9SS type A sorting domain-containing protein [Flavobacteriales bacterium]